MSSNFRTDLSLLDRFLPSTGSVSDETKKPPKTFEKTNQSSPKTYEQIIAFRAAPNQLTKKEYQAWRKTILVTSDTFGNIEP